ncbi:hypothetical protein [Lacipirellula limnantheis]|uniref:Transposase IS30-like HTH domain-containing protein n=1 Tax=Lacipirellula limnantheis TaxID=2528024 RepID=A0A517U0U4_9BACT|nr:hypothetical protein [Lacipirellula limnantheis]QDT74233.1 hypothetical protein I41_34280 [Lacipirellula limnantheis]
MSNPGRPRILDDKKRCEVITLLGVGLGLQEAARYVGCSVDTLRREMQRNEEFRDEARTAEVRAQIGAVRSLREAAATHWRAAAWYLERTNPRRFSRPSLRTFRPDEIEAVFSDVIAAAAEEIEDFELRDRVCRRLTIAGCRAARALESDSARRVDPRSVIPVRKSAADLFFEQFEEEQRRAWEKSATIRQNLQAKPQASTPTGQSPSPTTPATPSSDRPIPRQAA